MANVTYTVVKGDTLTSIANKYNTTVDKLVELNKGRYPYLEKNRDYITVDQVLVVKADSSTPTQNKNTSNAAVVDLFGLMSGEGNDRTMFATWIWDKNNTDNYRVVWYYGTGDGVWFVGSDSTSEYKQSTYTAPSNAIKVKFKVKPISKKKKENGKEVNHWTADWSTAKTYSFSNNPPGEPSAPSVTIDGYKLTATASGL